MSNISNSPCCSYKAISRSALLLSMLLFSGMALADRPEWAGSRDSDDDKRQSYKQEKKNGKYERENDRRDGDYNSRQESRRYSSRDSDRRSRVDIRIGGYIDDEHRRETREYYREYPRSGRCPPGLARKHNGCRPYGHARRWAMGEYLPRDVVYHTVEPEISIRLGTPPRGHEFVRVASDILLIAVGTGLVVDAIDDLGQ
jgi:Ni/Co efflux regulator RcnB